MTTAGTNEGLSADDATLAGDESGETGRQSHARPLARGDVIGRYMIVDQLGRGGMGVVYAAYDPELDRKLALKLLHAGAGSRETADREHARLMREAQSMARLNHPNVATVHDVGSHEGRVFIAMEFVDGVTLAQWLDAESRTRAQILQVFRSAGEGLVAAHARGLIHRDFKPDNVMVGQDGRVRVMDFGLAVPIDREETSEADELPFAGVGELRSEALDVERTRAGALVGTPRYMAPEQWSAEPTDARTDQFSFCVALYEALYGERPYAAENPAQQALAVTEGKVRDAPARSEVPGHLRRTILRGLGCDPEQRWPSMTALLEALERDPTRRRRRIGAVFGVGLAIAGGVGGVRLERSQAVKACEVLSHEIDEVWNPQVAEDLTRRLTADQPAYAKTVAEQLVVHLDGRVARWRALRRATCIAGDVEHSWSAQLAAGATDCHAEHRAAIETLIDVLMDAESAGATRYAIQAYEGLPHPEACGDESFLTNRFEPVNDEGRGRVLAVRADSWRVGALLAVGRTEDALVLAARVEEAAAGLESERLRAESALRRGEVEYDAREPTARGRLVDAYFASSGAGLDDLAAEAAIRVAKLDASRGTKDVKLEWARLAKVAMERARDDTPLRRARYLDALAREAKEAGDYDQAATLSGEALGLRREELGNAHPDVALNARDIGNVYGAGGRYAEALEHQQQALEAWTAAMGPQHPEIADFLGSIGTTHWFMGDYDAAERAHLRALEVRRASLPADNPSLAISYASLGHVHWARGEMDRAVDSYAKALELRARWFGPEAFEVSADLISLASATMARGDPREAAQLLRRAERIVLAKRGPEHEQLGQIYENLAQAHEQLGEDALAEEYALRALKIARASLGPEHPYVARSLVSVGEHAMRRGALDDALARFQEALDLWERALGPEHADVTRALLAIADVHRRAGRLELALPAARRALEIRTAHPDDLGKLGEARLELAKTLAAIDPKDAEALALARAAVEAFRDAGEEEAGELAEAQAWVDKHR